MYHTRYFHLKNRQVRDDIEVTEPLSNCVVPRVRRKNPTSYLSGPE